jgi:dihydrodipicolinate synthase/N-acetylneuraminate lyase
MTQRGESPGPEIHHSETRLAEADLHSRPSQVPRYQPRRGLSVPSVTILDENGRVLEEQQRAVFRHNAQEGLAADIIFGVGTTGEWNRISNAERQRLIWIEADEVTRINTQVRKAGRQPIEAWVGITSDTRAETLANLECALEAGVDAVVVAPLSIRDLGDVVSFFQREVSDAFDHWGRWLPVFLYDNSDIAVDARASHLRTRDVKRLSRLPFIFGVKVSAPRRVLGNYTKGALNFRDKGEFGIYIGNAMLMFQAFRLDDGLAGRVREYWNRYLLHNELPIGVVAGPANVMPREWQRAWRACYAGDDSLMLVYRSAFDELNAACSFNNRGKPVDKMLACLKYALRIDGVVESDLVAPGTPCLDEGERREFSSDYSRIKEKLRLATDPLWVTG